MSEGFFDRSFAVMLVLVFFACSATYNVGYFSTFGDTFWYFLYLPITFYDIVKTGLAMLLPFLLMLIVCKPVLVDPAFNGRFPGPKILLTVAVAVLLSNLLYFAIFINSSNLNYALVSECFFYISSVLCFFAVVYYFASEYSQQFVLSIFFAGLIPLAFLFGVVDAKIAVNSTARGTKSQILLSNSKVVSANILRSFDKGMFLIIDNPSSINFVSWSEIKEVKFRKISSF